MRRDSRRRCVRPIYDGRRPIVTTVADTTDGNRSIRNRRNCVRAIIASERAALAECGRVSSFIRCLIPVVDSLASGHPGAERASRLVDG